MIPREQVRGERGRFARMKGICRVCRQKAGQGSPPVCIWCRRAGCSPPHPRETAAEIRVRLLRAAVWFEQREKPADNRDERRRVAVAFMLRRSA